MEEFQGSWDVFYIIQHLEMKEKRNETLLYINVFDAWTRYSLENLIFKLSRFYLTKHLRNLKVKDIIWRGGIMM